MTILRGDAPSPPDKIKTYFCRNIVGNGKPLEIPEAAYLSEVLSGLPDDLKVGMKRIMTHYKSKGKSRLVSPTPVGLRDERYHDP